MTFKRYTAVLAFCEDEYWVALVQKNGVKFPRDKDRWNGIGGGLEDNESPAAGAAREFLEETGIHVRREELVHLETHRFNILTPDECWVYWYATRLAGKFVLPHYNDVGEVLTWCPVSWIRMGRAALCDNLEYLVPKAVRFLRCPPADRPF